MLPVFSAWRGLESLLFLNAFWLLVYFSNPFLCWMLSSFFNAPIEFSSFHRPSKSFFLLFSFVFLDQSSFAFLDPICFFFSLIIPTVHFGSYFFCVFRIFCNNYFLFAFLLDNSRLICIIWKLMFLQGCFIDWMLCLYFTILGLWLFCWFFFLNFCRGFFFLSFLLLSLFLLFNRLPWIVLLPFLSFFEVFFSFLFFGRTLLLLFHVICLLIVDRWDGDLILI